MTRRPPRHPPDRRAGGRAPARHFDRACWPRHCGADHRPSAHPICPRRSSPALAWRSYLEATFGRRWLPITEPWPVYLGVALGGAVAVDRASETRALLTTDAAGTAALAIQRDSVLRPIAWPLLSVGAESGAASVSYGVLLDVKDPAASFQRVSAGFVF